MNQSDDLPETLCDIKPKKKTRKKFVYPPYIYLRQPNLTQTKKKVEDHVEDAFGGFRPWTKCIITYK